MRAKPASLTGILSITLVALALGYWAGGRAAAVLSAGPRSDRVYTVFMLMPALSALSLVGACLVYPHFFPLLAASNLVAGSFVACIVLLGVPLVTTSAMNPLLIAIRMRTQEKSAAADAGAGRRAPRTADTRCSDRGWSCRGGPRMETCGRER